MAYILQTRRDTAANWTTGDPTLADGEMGFESDTNRFKIGDGTTAWTLLAYVRPGRSYCELRPTAVSHTPNTWIILNWTSVTDTDGYYSGGNPTRIVAPWTGLYHIYSNIVYNSANAQFLYSTSFNIDRAGSATRFADIPQMQMVKSYDIFNGAQAARCSGFVNLTAGQYIEHHIYQYSATRTIVNTSGGLIMRFIALT